MANAMLETLDGFSSVWVSMYLQSKSAFLQVTLNFETQIFLTILLSIAHFESLHNN